MIGKILESLYKKVFINIVLHENSTELYVEIFDKKKIQESFDKIFKSTALTTEMVEFVESLTKESPYSYISVLDNAQEQGALPTCEKTKFSLYEDLSTSEYKCIDEKWLTYTSKSELYELQKTYEDIGIDFIFSPFLLLENFFEDKVKSNFALYVLIQESSISCVVFDNSKLLFANHLTMELDAEYEAIDLDDELDEELDLDLGDDEGIVLDDIDADEELESLEDLGDIEDLDTLEEIDDFSDGKDLEEELEESLAAVEEENKTKTEESAKTFGDDYQRFNLIRESINKYYKNELYESRFLENIYIADSVKVSGDLRRYLEEELFLNVYIRTIDLGAELCELSKKELGV